MRFNSPYGIITLTNERRAHILTFHPDIVSATYLILLKRWQIRTVPSILYTIRRLSSVIASLRAQRSVLPLL